MADITLFRLDKNAVEEIMPRPVGVEKTVHSLIESHLEQFLNVRFLASEYSTGKTHKGRIDTLGIDRNRAPVIIEYKRASNENVITQGLFYLAWLSDHKAEFELLVTKKAGQEMASAIQWNCSRLICIASDFHKYDEQAVQQINRNIELIRYRFYGDALLLLERIAAQDVGNSNVAIEKSAPEQPNSTAQTVYLQRNETILAHFKKIMPDRAPLAAWNRAYMQVRTRYSGIHFEWYQRGPKDTKTIDVALHLENPSAEQNQALCDFLKMQKDKFVTRFGQEMVFQREWGNYSAVYIQRPCLPWTNEIAEWAAKNMEKLITSVEPLLQSYFSKPELTEGR
jgi:Domain of unknown function (DUF4268)